MEKIVGSSSLKWIGIFVIPTILFVLQPYWSANFKDNKSLEYETSSNSNLLGLGLDITDWLDLKVFYMDEELSNGGTFIISIKNTGTLPIRVSDFEEPISATFSEESSILGSRKVNSFPDSLNISSNFQENIFNIEPMLLNPDDYITVELFISGPIELENIATRIAGISNLTRRERQITSGLRIEYVEESDDNRTSVHRLYAELHPILMFLVSVTFLTYSFFAVMRVRDRASTVFELFGGFLCYVAGLGTASLFDEPMSAVYAASSRIPLFFLLPVICSLLLAFSIRYILRKTVPVSA